VDCGSFRLEVPGPARGLAALNQELLVRFLHEYPFQPATALWRAVEVDQLVAQGLPKGRGLDLGCGDGLLTRIIVQLVGGRDDLVGVDPDPDEIAHAQATGIYKALHAAGGDSVPESDASFDWVLSNSVLEHIDHLEPVLAEVGRLLRPNGEFVFTVPGPDFHACLRGPLLPGVSRNVYLRRLDDRLAHRRYWTLAKWRSALAVNRMQVVSSISYLDTNEVRRWESMARVTAGVLYTLGGRRRQPIEIQRRLGLRKPGRRMPMPLARSLAGFVALGLKRAAAPPSAKFGCYLIKAVKDPAALGSQ
jgi:SAM-dependent methyltransferase